MPNFSRRTALILGAGAASLAGATAYEGMARAAVGTDAVINVKDYGASGDGFADDTKAINDALAAIPPLGGIFRNIKGTLNRETQGGATVSIPPGVYKISGPITVGPRARVSAWGATFVAADSDACVRLIQYPAPRIFSGLGPTIEGLTFDGAYVATNGFWLQSTYLAGLELCMAVHTTGDGFRLEGSQYTVMSRCHATECGGWGLSITMNEGAAAPDGNNNSFIRFETEMNTLGGVKIGAGAIQNTFEGLTSQFHPSGIGLLMIGDRVLGNSVFGAHFEHNEIDIQFDAGAANNHVYSPIFWAGPETQRHVISNGISNIVDNPVLGNANGPQSRRNGVAACYEIGALGTLIVQNPKRIAGTGVFAADGSLMFVDENGQELDPSFMAIGTGRIVVREASDPRQVAETRFNKLTMSGASSGQPVFALRQEPDGHDRLLGYADGRLVWGTGSAAGDTTLSRLSAGILAVDGNPIGVKVAVPVTNNSPGSLGHWAADDTYLYLCTAENTWKRVAISADIW